MLIIQTLNSSKALFGIALIVMNFGSRYVVNDITKYHEYLLNSVIGKKIILFCMLLIGSRDIITSLCLFAAITLLLEVFLNEHSRLSILPASVKKHFLRNM
jgi:hypothetical protein